MKKTASGIVVLILILSGLVAVAIPHIALAGAGTTIYVDADATGANNGGNWTDAFTSLQDALDAAVSGDEIWIAAGTYNPSTLHGSPIGDRWKSFQMKNGVALYGGFNPSVGDDEFDERDWDNNATILSGDIGITGDDSDNCFRIFYHPGDLNLDATAVLDGFTITGGYTSSAGFEGGGMINYNASPTIVNSSFESNSTKADGGGMLNFDSSPIVLNCTFIGNSTTYGGGGMANFNSSPTVTNCTFQGNNAGAGGGMYNFESSPNITACTFMGSTASDNGGGMYNYHSSPILTKCFFGGNTADSNGGGMFNGGSSPTLTTCTFASNTASYGGGIFNGASFRPGAGGDDIVGSAPKIEDCLFAENSADNNGGGIYNADHYASPMITNCNFILNSATNGGGMGNSVSYSVTVTHCAFQDNTASDNGGGIFNDDRSVAKIDYCKFENNSASYGGGMYNNDDSGTFLTNCVFKGNKAEFDGGGICNQDSPQWAKNCIFTSNSADNGGGIYTDSRVAPEITNCTFTGNSAELTGGGMCNISSRFDAFVTNCILWGNIPNQIHNFESSPNITYSDVQGDYPGEGNIDEDPLLTADFLLQYNSPCIDTGTNSAHNLPSTDFEGEPRIMDGNVDGIAIVDMGADEYTGPVCDLPGSITLVKEINIGAVADGAFQFNTDSLGSFSMPYGSGNYEMVWTDLDPGDYTFTEAKPPEGWALTSTNCSGGDCSQTENGVVVHLDPGEDITVTFTNEYDDGGTPPIPEMPTILLMSLGLVTLSGFVWMRKRRQKILTT